MQDQMLERLDFISCSGNVDELLSLFLRSSHGTILRHVLEEVGHAENSIGSLSHLYEYRSMLSRLPQISITLKAASKEEISS